MSIVVLLTMINKWKYAEDYCNFRMSYDNHGWTTINDTVMPSYVIVNNSLFSYDILAVCNRCIVCTTSVPVLPLATGMSYEVIYV